MRNNGTNQRRGYMSQKILKSVDYSTKELLLYALSQDTLILELFTILGTKETLKLITFFGGTTVEIPTKQSIQKTIQNVLIYKLKEKGKSLTHIATTFQTTVDVVRQQAVKYKALVDRLEMEKKEATHIETVTTEELEDFVLSLEGEAHNEVLFDDGH